MELEALLQRITLVELDVEVAGNQMIGQLGVKHSRQQVAVALRMKRNEHRLACSRKDKLIIARHSTLLQMFPSP